MQHRDQLGQPLAKGDRVIVNGGALPGEVIETHSGLDPRNSQPMLVVAIVATVGCQPDGTAPSVFKLANPAALATA